MSLLMLLLACASLAFSQVGELLESSAGVSALPTRETLHYTIEWRLITAGEATLEWNASDLSHPQVNLRLESTGLVSKLFKVEDVYSASLNEELCARSSQLIAHEGRRQRETKVVFDSASRKAIYVERDPAKNAVMASQETEIPPCVHDVAGGLYFLRTLRLEPGQSALAPVSDGKKSVMAKVEALQREEVKTPRGTFGAIRYEVYLFNNALYRRPGSLDVWLTDDRRKLPVEIRVRLQFTIGTITLLLDKVE
jgi:Protein of unknown function (DUF3108)